MVKFNPKDFIKNIQKPIIIDKIQRVPELLISIKEYIDSNRINSQFILIGSAILKVLKIFQIH